MKPVLRSFAAFLGAAMLLTSMPVTAYYESSDEITLNLRAMSGGKGVFIPENDPNTVFISPEAAESGTTVHFGVYIETEKAELILMGLRLASDCDTILFNGENFINPSKYSTDEPVEYELPDGTRYQSKLTPFCFGKVNSMNVYTTQTYYLDVNFDTENNLLWSNWMSGFNNIDSFLGGRSDAYSFIEFDVDIAPGTEVGTHHISFLCDPDAENLSDRLTYASSFEGDPASGKYYDIIPTFKDVEIIVEAPVVIGDVNEDGQINASDAACILTEAALLGANHPGEFTPKQNTAADVNRDGIVDSGDAGYILLYSAADGIGSVTLPIEEWVAQLEAGDN